MANPQHDSRTSYVLEEGRACTTLRVIVIHGIPHILDDTDRIESFIGRGRRVLSGNASAHSLHSELKGGSADQHLTKAALTAAPTPTT